MGGVREKGGVLVAARMLAEVAIASARSGASRQLWKFEQFDQTFSLR